MNEVGFALIFYGLAALSLGSAVAVVMLRNLFHAALFLILSFIGVAGLYLTLQADFLAAVQILLYAGAIAVLIIFAVMMTQDTAKANTENRQWATAAIIAMLMLALIGTVVVTAVWPISREAPLEITTEAIAEVLFNQYVLPFEIASVLLLAAMIGALVLARGERR